MTDSAVEKEHWSVDKKVPIALIVAILGQTGAFVWWGATMSARVDILERDNAKLERRVESGESAARGVSERLVRVEEKSSTILDLVRQIAERDRKRNGD